MKKKKRVQEILIVLFAFGILVLFVAAGRIVTYAKESKEDTVKNKRTEDIYYFTEDTDYSKIERCEYSEIDWTKYGNNGIKDEGTKEYLESMGIDAEKDETYGVTLANKLASMPMTMGIAEDWAVGTVHWGMCDITSSWFVPSEGQSYFTLGNFRDGLEGVEMIGAGWCADHTAAEPAAGHQVISVMCTVTSVDPSTGWIYMNLYLTPYDATTGQSNQWGLIGYQHISANVRVRKPFNGTAKIIKKSAKSEVTLNNSGYSLEGAYYGIWKNRECTDGTGLSFTTNADGVGELNGTLPAGTYYIKELTAPTGYALDPTIYTINIQANGTATLNVSDTPIMNPLGILLGKVDAATNQNKPAGSGTLEGALFTVKYYDGYYDSDPAAQGKNAKKTWIFRTNNEGVCYYDNSYLQGGSDELYLNLDGKAALPLGTVTIQETKSPSGYQKNDTIYTVKITEDGKDSASVQTYNKPTVPETSLDLELTKKLKGTEIMIPGAKFKHTLPNGTTEILTTDGKGKAVFQGLTWGKHIIEEESVPEGYTKNPGKIAFTVGEDNTIRVTENTATDLTGKMTFTVKSDGNASLVVEDTYAPYRLHLTKENETGKKLQGAEFTLYSDKTCTKEVAKGTTTEDGTLEFQNLQVETKYYLKETKAPKGYRIPVNPDGSAIVYEIYTKSNPLEHVFEYYVNGTKHTEKDGIYAITGTKENRIVNLTVVNDTGVQMPETGSPLTLLLVLAGTGCMAGALVYAVRKGKKEDCENEKKN